MPVEIFSHYGLGDEEWLTVEDDGMVKYVDSPGNGWSRRCQTIMTAETAAKRWPKHAEAIKAASAAVRAT